MWPVDWQFKDLQHLFTNIYCCFGQVVLKVFGLQIHWKEGDFSSDGMWASGSAVQRPSTPFSNNSCAFRQVVLKVFGLQIHWKDGGFSSDGIWPVDLQFKDLQHLI